MSGGISFGHKKGNQANPAGMYYDDPPHASWGQDAYIEGLLRRAEPRGDSFSRGGGQGGGHDKKSILSSITKWAGIGLAGVLGFLGLKKFGPRLFR
jgi:hypothetical protein